MSKERVETANSLRGEARRAKSRIKSGFWAECKEEFTETKEKAEKSEVNSVKTSNVGHGEVGFT